MEKVSIPRIVVAGTHSGVGKTTVTLALTKALRAKGLKVACFKCGPDYLDPTYHERASSRKVYNLDSWLMPRETLISTFVKGAKDADIAIIEGVMGLYDGVDPTKDRSSTAEIAKWLDAPVALVVDASGMSRSIAAIARGFRDFDSKLDFAGVICNRVGSKKHLQLLEKALSPLCVFGGFTKNKDSFPERHLGLVTASRGDIPESPFESWGENAISNINIAKLVEVAKRASPINSQNESLWIEKAVGVKRIGYALDEAFHFYYDYNLNLLESYGAQLVPFSPIKNKEIPKDLDALIFGGGYPEVYAEELSNNESMKNSIREFSKQKKVIYGECGGLIYLSNSLALSASEQAYSMVGLINADVKMEDRLKALGYIEVETSKDSFLGPKSTSFKGHQFRYSQIKYHGDQDEHLYSVCRFRDKKIFKEGYGGGHVLGSYVHAHWGSNPDIAKNFVESI